MSGAILARCLINKKMMSILRKPSAWIPIAMSLTVLAAMIVYIALSGPPVREPDEGVGAHLFQIWLVLEVLTIAFFAITWLPRAPKEGALILALQIAAVFAACAPVRYFHL